MENTYRNLVDQLFKLPKDGFEVVDDRLYFNGIDLNKVVAMYSTPMKLTYLPRIGQNIEKARNHFKEAISKFDYQGNYTYCYCTKSNHFSFVIYEALKAGVHLETSSAYDMHIIERLIESGKTERCRVLEYD